MSICACVSPTRCIYFFCVTMNVCVSFGSRTFSFLDKPVIIIITELPQAGRIIFSKSCKDKFGVMHGVAWKYIDRR